MSSVTEKFKFKDELRKSHLYDFNKKKYNFLVSLRCSNRACKKRHPSSPAALIWWKLQKDKGKLVCPFCRHTNFNRTDAVAPQHQLFQEALFKKTKRLKEHFESELDRTKGMYKINKRIPKDKDKRIKMEEDRE